VTDVFHWLNGGLVAGGYKGMGDGVKVRLMGAAAPKPPLMKGATPYGGRSAASSGPRWAITTFEK